MFGSRKRAIEEREREERERRDKIEQHRRKYSIFEVYPGASLAGLIKDISMYEKGDLDLNSRRLSLLNIWEDVEIAYFNYLNWRRDSKKKEDMHFSDELHNSYNSTIVNFNLYSSELAQYGKIKPFSDLLKRIGDLYHEKNDCDRWGLYLNVENIGYYPSYIFEGHAMDHNFGRDVVLVLEKIENSQIKGPIKIPDLSYKTGKKR